MALSEEQARQALLDLPDEALAALEFSFPWQNPEADSSASSSDGDFKTKLSDLNKMGIDELQKECWAKYHTNPQINTAIRGVTGRICGLGFEVTSGVREIQKVITETELDWRNRLYNFWPKYYGRFQLDGELYLILTLHPDGFVEVDYLDPSDLQSGKGEAGIIWHPTKTCMPLIYCIRVKDQDGQATDVQIPSIFLAKFPSLINIASVHRDYNKDQLKTSKRTKNYKETGGFFRFVVGMDKGLVTRRAVSHLLTVLKWLNYYENLKQYEIDHKKSSGAYLWSVKFTDTKAFKLWLGLSDDERRKTGILQKKVPGGTLILPPGVDLEVKNPNLPSIKDQDTDILHMITSGLNEAEDVSTGKSGGTFASVSASRGPMSDRISDEIAYFDRFQKHDFWASVFLLRGSVGAMKKIFVVKECVDFDDQKEKFEDVEYSPQELVEISYPVSETIDFEGRARGLLGVKHGPVAETLGMSGKDVALRMGIGAYSRMRLRKATEDKKFPELKYNVDAETLQEAANGKNGTKDPANKSPEQQPKKAKE